MFGFLKPLLPPEPKEPLAPVLAPEAVGSSGRGKGHVLGRVLSESRRALDADPASFQRLTTREGWSVSCRPVEGTKVRRALEPVRVAGAAGRERAGRGRAAECKRGSAAD